MASSVVLVEGPTGVITARERIYRATYRVCSDEPCFSMPRSITLTNLEGIPETYDMRPMCGVTSKEFDSGAIISSVSVDNRLAEPELCDIEAIFPDEVEDRVNETTNICSEMCDRVCCRLVTVEWRATVIRGETDPVEIVKLCPEMQINGQLYEVPVSRATFKGFYEASNDAECCGPQRLTLSTDPQRDDACYKVEVDKCYRPHITNGTPIELFAEESETDIRIRELALEQGRTDAVASLEGRTNCAPLALAIPCLGLFMNFETNTVKFEGLFSNSERINGRDMWRRETVFRHRKDGWDFYAPNSGLDAATCEGPWEGTTFLDAAGDCKQGTLIRQDCVDCPSHPGKRSIVDLFGNGIREPIPLSLNGQPLCDVKKFYWLRWQARCCGNFDVLPWSPHIAVINYIREPRGPDGQLLPVPAVIPDPPEPCTATTNDGEIRKIYYRVNNTIYTFECSNGAWRLRLTEPGPASIVFVNPLTPR